MFEKESPFATLYLCQHYFEQAFVSPPAMDKRSSLTPGITRREET
jgi:hypothetical protein